MSERKKIKPGELVVIRMTQQERTLLVDHTLVDPEYPRRLRPEPDGKGLVAEYTLDDLEELLGSSQPRPVIRRTRGSARSWMRSTEGCANSSDPTTTGAGMTAAPDGPPLLGSPQTMLRRCSGVERGG